MIEELEESELGSHEYWEARYQTEVKNYRTHGDVGDVWFEDIVHRLIKWLKNSTFIDRTHRILDVGCGNGMLLIEIYNEGYTNLRGVDYSEQAIVLAEEIANKCKCNINFATHDILARPLDQLFDVVFDKGTYDAISLTARAKENRTTYITNIYETLKGGGVLIITSCNWTNEELVRQFEMKFSLLDTIPTPQFQFGGKVGNVVSSVVLKKK